jgi:exodeoxyribonuclease X
MIRVIDFETTGLPPEADVVEAAFVDARGLDGAVTAAWSSIVASSRAITPEARAAHHITDKEISAGIEWMHATAMIMSPYPENLYCAHNADFEKAFFNPEGSRWIDTYKCALRLFPEAPKHTNSVLRYFIPGCDPGPQGMPPHRALPDCYVTAAILARCLEGTRIDQLIAWSLEPPLLPRVPMGKHFGKSWSEVPTDYLEWATRQDFDAGVAHTVRVELAKRRKR